MTRTVTPHPEDLAVERGMPAGPSKAGALRKREYRSRAPRMTLVVGAAVAVAILAQGTARANEQRGSSTEAVVARAERHAPVGAVRTPNRSIRVSVNQATATVTSAAGDLRLTANDAQNSVVRARPDGVQAFTVLHQGSTARFTVDLPAGQVLKPAGAGFRITDRSGRVSYGEVEAPWAVDAVGKRLRTAYALHGNEIVQTVAARGAVRPLTLDPYFRWYWNGVVITLSHAEMGMVAAGGVEALKALILVPGVGWKAFVAVAWVASYAGWAYRNRKCAWFWVSYWVHGSTAGFYSC